MIYFDKSIDFFFPPAKNIFLVPMIIFLALFFFSNNTPLVFSSPLFEIESDYSTERASGFFFSLIQKRIESNTPVPKRVQVFISYLMHAYDCTKCMYLYIFFLLLFLPPSIPCMNIWNKHKIKKKN